MAKRGPIRKNSIAKKRNLKRENASHNIADQSGTAHQKAKSSGLGTVLRNIVEQIDDADRSNSDTLQDMYGRLEVLYEQTKLIKKSDQGTNAKALERIETQISDLSDHIEIISQGHPIEKKRHLLEQRIEELAEQIYHDEDAENEDAETEHSETQSYESPDHISQDIIKHYEAHQKEQLDPEADITFAVTEEIDANIDLDSVAPKKYSKKHKKALSSQNKAGVKSAPIQKSVSTDTKDETATKLVSDVKRKNQSQNKTSLVITPQAMPSEIGPERLATLAQHFTPVVEKKPPIQPSPKKRKTLAQPTQAREFVKNHSDRAQHKSYTNSLEERFALIAAKLENTLDQRAYDLEERIEISNKFDYVSEKLEELLVLKSDIRPYAAIEGKLDRLTAYIKNVEYNANRIDRIELQLEKFIEVIEQTNHPYGLTKEDLTKTTEKLLQQSAHDITDNVVKKISKALTQNPNPQKASHQDIDDLSSSVQDLKSRQEQVHEQQSDEIKELHNNLHKISLQLDELISTTNSPDHSDNLGVIKKKLNLDETPHEDDYEAHEATPEQEASQQNFFSEELSSHIKAIDDEQPDLNEELDADISDHSHSSSISNSTIRDADPIETSLENASESSPEEKNIFEPDDITYAVENDIEFDYISKQEDLTSAAQHASIKASKQQKDSIRELLNLNNEGDKIESQTQAKIVKKHATQKIEYIPKALFLIFSITGIALGIFILINELAQQKVITASNTHIPLDAKNQKITGSLSEQSRTSKIVATNTPQNERTLETDYSEIAPSREEENHDSLRRLEQNVPQTTQSRQMLPPSSALNSPQQETSSISAPPYDIANGPQQDIEPEIQRSNSQKQRNDKGIPIPKVVTHNADLPPAKIGPFSLRSAAANGDAKAQYKVGMRFIDGKSIERDYESALRWLKLSALQGYPQAQFHLAALYEHGKGVAKNWNQAKTWYQRAANNGNIKAMHNLGAIHTSQFGKKPDYESASLWFMKAANHGVSDSQFNLGILFQNGLGVEKDLVEALKWFMVAGHNGDSQAAKRNQSLRKIMTKQDIELSEKRFKAWLQRPLNRKANGTIQRILPPPSTQLKQAARGNTVSSTTHTKNTLVLEAQILLRQLGYDVGSADGTAGPKTRSAIKKFQKSIGTNVTGDVTSELISKLTEKLS
ncbi:MAG: peptidoglycan-binding protein [Pseudomonadota bacterium]